MDSGDVNVAQSGGDAEKPVEVPVSAALAVTLLAVAVRFPE